MKNINKTFYISFYISPFFITLAVFVYNRWFRSCWSLGNINKTLTVSKAGACLRLIKIVPHPCRLELPGLGAGVTSPCFPLSYPNSEISNILAI
jgi:hypothetical protein